MEKAFTYAWGLYLLYDKQTTFSNLLFTYIYSAGIDFRRQILTSKVYLRTVRVQIFIMAVDIGIQMRQKELTKWFMMISNLKNPLVSIVYTQTFYRFKGQNANAKD